MKCKVCVFVATGKCIKNKWKQHAAVVLVCWLLHFGVFVLLCFAHVMLSELHVLLAEQQMVLLSLAEGQTAQPSQSRPIHSGLSRA